MTSFAPIDIGPFGDVKKNTLAFCHNLYIAQAIGECVIHLQALQQQYNDAVQSGASDEDIEHKLVEIQGCQSSLVLAAYLFESDDGLSA